MTSADKRQDIAATLNETLKDMARPRLLVRAARLAAGHREGKPRPRGLERISAHALIAHEAKLDAARRSGDANYSATRHVEALSAMLSAAR